jgi:hypothetical protein
VELRSPWLIFISKMDRFPWGSGGPAPLGCLHLRGREGVTNLTIAEDFPPQKKIRISPEHLPDIAVPERVSRLFLIAGVPVDSPVWGDLCRGRPKKIQNCLPYRYRDGSHIPHSRSGYGRFHAFSRGSHFHTEYYEKQFFQNLKKLSAMIFSSLILP